jgi:transglutaminase superfamily protein
VSLGLEAEQVKLDHTVGAPDLARMKLLLQWARRAPNERALLLEAALVLLWAAVRLEFGQKWLLRRLRPSPAAHRTEPAHSEAARLARAVDAVAAHLPIRSNCLVRSLALHRLLRRHNLPAELHLGANRRGTDQPEFHAWVTCAGCVILSGSANPYDFVPLATHR